MNGAVRDAQRPNIPDMVARVIPPHGTRARYYHRDAEVRCRADCCRAAQRAYQRRYRRDGPDTFTTRSDGFRQLRIPPTG